MCVCVCTHTEKIWKIEEKKQPELSKDVRGYNKDDVSNLSIVSQEVHTALSSCMKKTNKIKQQTTTYHDWSISHVSDVLFNYIINIRFFLWY